MLQLIGRTRGPGAFHVLIRKRIAVVVVGFVDRIVRRELQGQLRKREGTKQAEGILSCEFLNPNKKAAPSDTFQQEQVQHHRHTYPRSTAKGPQCRKGGRKLGGGALDLLHRGGLLLLRNDWLLLLLLLRVGAVSRIAREPVRDEKGKLSRDCFRRVVMILW